jgi:hypothetical protein
MLQLLVSHERLASAVADQEDAYEPPTASLLHLAGIEGSSADLPPFPHKAPAPHPCLIRVIARAGCLDNSLKGGGNSSWNSFTGPVVHPIPRHALFFHKHRRTLSFGTCVRG